MDPLPLDPPRRRLPAIALLLAVAGLLAPALAVGLVWLIGDPAVVLYLAGPVLSVAAVTTGGTAVVRDRAETAGWVAVVLGLATLAAWVALTAWILEGLSRLQ